MMPNVTEAQGLAPEPSLHGTPTGEIRTYDIRGYQIHSIPKNTDVI